MPKFAERTFSAEFFSPRIHKDPTKVIICTDSSRAYPLHSIRLPVVTSQLDGTFQQHPLLAY